MNKYSIIYAIVVTWNGSKWINRCVNSLIGSDIPLNIIIVDNSSVDNTTEILKKYCSDIQLINLRDNIGFGKANNIGMKLAVQNNAEYIFLMNQDAWIEPDTIRKLVDISIKNPEYGILSPFHLTGDEKNIDHLFAYCLAMNTDIISDLYIPPCALKEVYDTDFVNAAFWLLTSNCVNTVGGFDPLFYVYGEDNDYINRVIYHGFKIGICPKIKVYHDRPQKHNDTNININRIHGTEILFAKTYLPPFIKIIVKAFTYSMIFAINRNQINKYRAIAFINIIRQYRRIKIHHFKSKLRGLTYLD